MTDVTEFDYGDDESLNAVVPGGVEVITPSGAKLYVLTQGEEEQFTDAASRYLKDNKLTNIADLQDLEKILMMELMCYRWGSWIIREEDYFGERIDQDKISKALQETSKELRQLKKSLGIDKASRDRDKGESWAMYVENLRHRAQEFGVKRNEEAVKALTLFKELQALIEFNQNCTPTERKENHCEQDDIWNWILETMLPEYKAIDEKFRKTSQSTWIRET